jgi:chromosome segregation ATPase
VQAQENVIRQLQQRRDSETVAKEKAEYALREKAQGLDHCNSQRKLMQLELKHCTGDMEELKSDVRQWRARVGF